MNNFIEILLTKPNNRNELFALLFSWLLVLMVAAILTGIFMLATESIVRKMYTENGVVENRKYKSAHSTTRIEKHGNTNVPITTFHPEEYYLVISVKDKTDQVEVSPYIYQNVNIGQPITVKYCYGRYTKSLYIKEVIY